MELKSDGKWELEVREYIPKPGLLSIFSADHGTMA
jgi:hypothetical protein